MTEFSHYITQVDAFANVPLSGNPCAVVFGADDLSSEQMQSIALEMNLSETAFVLQSDKFVVSRSHPKIALRRGAGALDGASGDGLRGGCR